MKRDESRLESLRRKHGSADERGNARIWRQFLAIDAEDSRFDVLNQRDRIRRWEELTSAEKTSSLVSMRDYLASSYWDRNDAQREEILSWYLRESAASAENTVRPTPPQGT